MNTIHWIRSYTLLLKWQGLKFKTILPFVIVAQFFTGIGTVIGLGYLMPDIDPQTAMFLVTGGPTLSLITLGLVMVPQMVAQAKSGGMLDYMRSFPVPRMAYMAADLTIWLFSTLPGVILALIVGSLRYDFELQFSLLIVPAFILIVLMATSVGYAIAMLSPKAELVGVLTNLIIFSLFLFSPVNFPVERLPNWLETIHRFLPVKYAADAVRGALVPGYSVGLGLALAVLGAWCLLGLAINYIAATRRG
ncbi:MAG: ABC transporter permease [Anaerolineales bacterium]|jgi:ABC-2 type transport system permease protein